MPDPDKTDAAAKHDKDEIADVNDSRKGERGAKGTEPPEDAGQTAPPPHPH